MKDKNVPSEIIGIVGDSKQLGLDQEIGPMAYWPQAELPSSSITIAIRTKGDANAAAPSVRAVINRLDAEQPVTEVKDMESLLAVSVARSRFSTTLLTVFSFVALAMAMVGIYGVMAYAVVQRTHEIGVRLALGAQRGDVLKLVVRQGVILAIIGITFGLAAAFGLTRLIASLLFEVAPTDRVAFLIVTICVFVVTLVASYIPARRATKIDPLKALRYE